MKPLPSKMDSPLTRIVVIALTAGALVQLIMTGSAAAPEPAERLELGKPIERGLEPGDTHVYEVAVTAQHVVLGTVEQRGIDLVVRVVDPSGAAIERVDSPNGLEGPEPWIIEAKDAGTWRVEVSSFDRKARPGRYEARIDEVMTMLEAGERNAKASFVSPRLLRLWHEHRAAGASAIARFAKEMEGHAPLVEPVPDDPAGDMFITYLWRGSHQIGYVGLLGGTAGRGETPLLRFEDTDLRYLTVRVPRDSRFTYLFQVGDMPNFGAMPDQKALRPLRIEWDPWNPRADGGGSIVELPGAPAQPWTEPLEGVPPGRVVEERLHSEVLGEDRKLGIYLPAGLDPAAGPYPYVVVFDGEVSGLGPNPPVPVPAILDNLIAKGKLPLMLGVLVANPVRNRDLGMSAPFCDFLAKELVPWLRREHRAAEAPDKVTLAGASLGGLASAYCAFQHPEVFGNVLSQSGAFQFAPGIFEAPAGFHVEHGALMREVIRTPRKPVRFWMEVGRFEGAAGDAGINLLAQNRHMRDVLLAKGYDVSYREYSGGHNYVCWRGGLAEGLIALASQPHQP